MAKKKQTKLGQGLLKGLKEAAFAEHREEITKLIHNSLSAALIAAFDLAAQPVSKSELALRILRHRFSFMGWTIQDDMRVTKKDGKVIGWIGNFKYDGVKLEYNFKAKQGIEFVEITVDIKA